MVSGGNGPHTREGPKPPKLAATTRGRARSPLDSDPLFGDPALGPDTCCLDVPVVTVRQNTSGSLVTSSFVTAEANVKGPPTSRSCRPKHPAPTVPTSQKDSRRAKGESTGHEKNGWSRGGSTLEQSSDRDCMGNYFFQKLQLYSWISR